ncbi:MAG: choice-of-anchor D domain-containing protein [Dehalococcoidia bacterium]|jgi:uncharacterized repeat protein (TIGR01451 family)
MKKISLIIILTLLIHLFLPIHALAAATPGITVTPGSIDFGSVTVGSSSPDEVVTISNDGDADLCIYDVALKGADISQFTITNNVTPNLILPPCASANVSVQFKPLTEGNKHASLVIHSNDPCESYLYIPLTGTGVPKAYADVEITKSDDPDPVITGGTITYTVNVANKGPDAATGVTVTDNLPEGVVFQSATTSTGLTDYLSGNITWEIGPLASGASAGIVIEVIAPAEAGIITNRVSVSGNEDDPVPANNEAIEDTDIIMDINTAPDINVSPLSVNFGSLQAGFTSSPATITVTNTGNADLVIGSIVIDNTRFLMTGTGIAGQTLIPGASGYIRLVFHPAWNGVHTGTLSIFSNDPDENPVIVTLSGYGVVIPPITISTPVPPTTSPGGTAVSPKYFTVDFLGKITRVPASDDGRPLEDIAAYSPDYAHLLEIDKGTRAIDRYGNPVTYIVISRIQSPPLLENTALIGEAYNFKPSGTTFDRGIMLTLGYDVDDLPDKVISLATAYYDSKLGWTYLDSISSQIAEVGELIAAVNHFTVFAILAQLSAQPPIIDEIETEISSPPSPALFTLDNLVITTSESRYGETLTFLARYGEDATITVNVSNIGDTGGVYQAVLRFNGEEKDSTEFSLGAGETLHITFNTTGNEPGKYIVQVGELHGEFKSELWINWWLITGFTLLIILLGWLVVFLIRRRTRIVNQEG